MIKYLDAMFEKWPEELKGYTPNPHQDHLFEVRADDDSKKDLLNEEMASQFHRTTAQLPAIHVPESLTRYSDRSVILHNHT